MGDEVRWGFEHLQLDPAREGARGGESLPLDRRTWDNHEGDGYVTFQQWDVASGTSCPTDRPRLGLLRPIIEKSSEAYAAEKGLPIRTQADADEVVTN